MRNKSKKWAEVEEKILAAVERGKAAGVDLVFGSFGWYKPGGKCCALSMVVGDEYAYDVVNTSAEKLGITRNQAWEIAFAFDAAPRLPLTAAGRVGRDLRLKLQPPKAY